MECICADIARVCTSPSASLCLKANISCRLALSGHKAGDKWELWPICVCVCVCVKREIFKPAALVFFSGKAVIGVHIHPDVFSLAVWREKTAQSQYGVWQIAEDWRLATRRQRQGKKSKRAVSHWLVRLRRWFEPPVGCMSPLSFTVRPICPSPHHLCSFSLSSLSLSLSHTKAFGD